MLYEPNAFLVQDASDDSPIVGFSQRPFLHSRQINVILLESLWDDSSNTVLWSGHSDASKLSNVVLTHQQSMEDCSVHKSCRYLGAGPLDVWRNLNV